MIEVKNMSRNKMIRMTMGGILLAVSLAAGITVYDLEKDNNRPPMRNEALLIAQIGSIMKRANAVDDAIHSYELCTRYFTG